MIPDLDDEDFLWEGSIIKGLELGKILNLNNQELWRLVNKHFNDHLGVFILTEDIV